MRLLHISHGASVEGGRETHLRRFCELSRAQGAESAVIGGDPLPRGTTADDLLDAGRELGLTGPPDAVFLHDRGSWPQAREASTIAPTYAWVHDYAFVCPATIAWFRRDQDVCDLPLGIHCVVNAYTKGCNARRPHHNIQNYRAVSGVLESLDHFSGVLVASQFVKARLVVGGIRPDMIHIVPYFVPRVAEVADARRDDGRSVLFVGRLNELKGVDLLLEAMRLLPDNCTLTIAGDGYSRSNLERHARRIGLGPDRVAFRGYVHGWNDLAELYRASSVLAIPSLWPEPFGIVGLEALLFGRPVVAFDVGGISEWLEDEWSGLLAKPGNVDDLAAKLGRFLTDPHYRHVLGNQGRQAVLSRFGPEEHWRRFMQVVEPAADAA
jgi:glycosyltransferase involved in cell wall biosynthesis